MKIFRVSGKCDYKKAIKPDFVFYYKKDGKKEPKPFFILDAKFKPKWYSAASRSELKYVFDDYQQVVNYMFSYNTHAAGVIFPTNEKVDCPSVFDISEYNTGNKFYCYSILVPECEGDYQKWCDKFQKNVDEHIDEIVETLKSLSPMKTD